jgi:hypothetical protein
VGCSTSAQVPAAVQYCSRQALGGATPVPESSMSWTNQTRLRSTVTGAVQSSWIHCSPTCGQVFHTSVFGPVGPVGWTPSTRLSTVSQLGVYDADAVAVRATFTGDWPAGTATEPVADVLPALSTAR